MRRSAIGVWLTCATLAAGCGGSQPDPTPAKAAPTAYDLQCKALADAHAEEIAARTYLPPALIVHKWPASAPAAAPASDAAASETARPATDLAPQRVIEPEMVELLASGRSRVTLVIARGGTGKSKLAWAIEALACKQLPVFKADLQWDIAWRMDEIPEHSNPLLGVVAKKLGVYEQADPLLALKEKLGDKPWLMILDSLDEVTLKHRSRVVETIEATLAADRLPVMMSPPVYGELTRARLRPYALATKELGAKYGVPVVDYYSLSLLSEPLDAYYRLDDAGALWSATPNAAGRSWYLQQMLRTVTHYNHLHESPK